MDISDSLDQSSEAADTVANEVFALAHYDKVQQIVRSVFITVTLLQSVEADPVLTEDGGQFAQHVIMVRGNEDMSDSRI